MASHSLCQLRLAPGTRNQGNPRRCYSLRCFGIAAIKLAGDAGRLEHPVVLKDDAECRRLNFATMDGGTRCVTAGR